jgi:hypothetical protein
MIAPFCPGCGAQAAPDQRFCTSWGAPLTQPIPSPEAASPEAIQSSATADIASPEAIQSTATADIAGRGCPYCRLPLKEGGAIIECGACHAVHHDDCYTENGSCAVAGCADRPTSQSAAAVTRVMPTPDEVTATPTQAPAARIPDWRRKPATMIAIAASLLALACGGATALLIADNSNATPSTPSAATVTETLPAATVTNDTPTDAAGATTTSPAAPAQTPPSAVVAVESFYALAASHQYAEAWALADPTFRTQLGGYHRFQAGQAGDRSITFDAAHVVISGSSGDATVAVQTTSVRTDATQHCLGTVDLVSGGASGWLLHLIYINCT